MDVLVIRPGFVRDENPIGLSSVEWDAPVDSTAGVCGAGFSDIPFPNGFEPGRKSPLSSHQGSSHEGDPTRCGHPLASRGRDPSRSDRPHALHGGDQNGWDRLRALRARDPNARDRSEASQDGDPNRCDHPRAMHGGDRRACDHLPRMPRGAFGGCDRLRASDWAVSGGFVSRPTPSRARPLCPRARPLSLGTRCATPRSFRFLSEDFEKTACVRF